MQAAELKAFYHFAFLLTGTAEAAEELIVEVLPKASGQAGQFRYGRNSKAFLITHLRRHCMANFANAASFDHRDEDTGRLAHIFANLPEPDRCALALFYSNLLKTSDAAEILGMDLPEYSAAVSRGRLALSAAFLDECKTS